MLQTIDQVSTGGINRTADGALSDRASIEAVFRRVMALGVNLAGGVSRNHEIRHATVVDVSPTRVRLKLEHFDPVAGMQIAFNFQLDGHEYFFSAKPLRDPVDSQVEIPIPASLCRSERRERYRDTETAKDSSLHVDLTTQDGRSVSARVINRSPTGIGIELPEEDCVNLPSDLVVRPGTKSETEPSYAKVRHQTAVPNRSGWVRIGLSLSALPPGKQIEIDRRERILEQTPATRAWDRAELLAGAFRSVPARAVRRFRSRTEPNAEVPIVDYQNDRGEMIRAIVDTWGDPRGSTAVVIPPAWGRTKETLLPLAATLLETFRRAGQPVTILRFDGTHRRGESHLNPGCRSPGEEYQYFTFSQAVRDIESTITFLDSDDRYQPSTIILVTFSLAAIEGRRAVACDLKGRIGGWVSTVGMVDLQSALRTISGGINFGYGLQRGEKFGRHELVGVVADMDHTGRDALEHNLVFLEDARQDLDKIKTPVTWIHGRHDGWMNIESVREVLSCGQTANRKLIEVPTGHQLRTSREALSTFQLVAEEVSAMALGQPVRPRVPSLPQLAQRQGAERERLPKPSTDIRGFWRDYLLGRDRRIGMQLLTATEAYRCLMETQLRLLGLGKDQRVADLGSGTGEFPLSLARSTARPPGIRVDEVDYVGEALHRSAQRLASIGDVGIEVQHIVADLDSGNAGHIPLADGTYDAVLVSLVVSYLGDPKAFLREARRLLRPGGRLVVSTLRRDADISKLYVDGLAELRSTKFQEVIGSEPHEFEKLARDFLNDASKILDLEEQGQFQFWDESEFADLVTSAGFRVDAVERDLGTPSQAIVVSARWR